MSYGAIVLMPDEVILLKISGTTDDQIRQALGSSRQAERKYYGETLAALHWSMAFTQDSVMPQVAYVRHS